MLVPLLLSECFDPVSGLPCGNKLELIFNLLLFFDI